MAGERAVFADATRERDGVEAAHHGSVGADVLADAMRVNRNRAAAVLVAVGRATLDRGEVDGAA